MENEIYGLCSECGTPLKAIWATIEEEYIDQGRRIKTGKKMRIVDYLCCPDCLKTECVDDSFDYYIK